MDSTAEPPAAEAFYDARRGVYYIKPAWRGWLHLLWFEVSLVFGTLLLAGAHGATRITAGAVYAASVSGMFGISALYHCGNWREAWRQRLQRLDHAMIFFLIAGPGIRTATQMIFLCTSMPATRGWTIPIPASLHTTDTGYGRAVRGARSKIEIL
jgi:predicted membrane channel-forming protein YqfA (hemolysin III family)